MARHMAPLTLSVLIGLTLAGAASSGAYALDIMFPKDKPKVAFQVPDGWSVTYTAIGVEMASPEKNSFVVANVVKRDRPVVDGWTKRANEALIANGIKFDKNAKVPPPPVKAAAPAQSTIPAATSDVPLNPFTLSGEPSAEMKSAPPSEIQPQDGPVAMMPDKLGGIAQPDKPKIPFRVVQFYGASVGDKPVDVQLIVFKISRDELFLLEQESGSDDSRTISIITSVKPAG